MQTPVNSPNKDIENCHCFTLEGLEVVTVPVIQCALTVDSSKGRDGLTEDEGEALMLVIAGCFCFEREMWEFIRDLQRVW